jgi:hypothetical protein
MATQKTYFQNNEQIFKVVAIVVLGSLAFYILLGLYRKLISFLATDTTTSSASENIVDSELSYTTLEYMSMAEQVYNAVKGWGTNEDAIYTVLNKLNNSSDWYRLVKAYGIRKKSNIIEALYSDLTNSEIESVQTILQNINVTF